MALVKVNNDLAGRRGMVKVVSPKPQGALTLRCSRRRPVVRRTTTATSRFAIVAAVKQHYRVVDFRRNKGWHPGQGRAPGIRPQRTAHIDCVC